MEDINRLITSKGCVDNSYKFKGTESSSSQDEIINLIKNFNRVIFIRTGSSSKINDLDIFSVNLNYLNKDCILVTSDGDRTVPLSYNDKTVELILNNTFIKKWYSQNLNKKDLNEKMYKSHINLNKLEYFPIGFDFHTTRWFINNSAQDKIKYMIKIRQERGLDNRYNKIYSDSHNSVSHNDRRIVKDLIKNNRLFELENFRINFAEITKKYNEYNFVISPRGNGIDCHRTWELFLAGAIVILKTSCLDDMFLKNNLPVIILKDWSELNNLTIEDLERYLKENREKRSLENILSRLTFKYWLKEYYDLRLDI